MNNHGGFGDTSKRDTQKVSPNGPLYNNEYKDDGYESSQITLNQDFNYGELRDIYDRPVFIDHHNDYLVHNEFKDVVHPITQDSYILTPQVQYTDGVRSADSGAKLLPPDEARLNKRYA